MKVSSSASCREGDFVETREKLIFDVKGLVHPPDRVIAFLRYFPSETGDRMRERTRYQKVYSLEDRFTMLKEKDSSYIYFDQILGSTMQGVPLTDIDRLHQPTQKLRELSASRRDLRGIVRESLDFCELLSGSAGISPRKLGVTGSVLVGLQSSTSDIDVIVYGIDNCISVYEAIGSLYLEKKSKIRPYTRRELKKLFRFRSSDTFTQWESFLRTESGKRLQGIYNGHDYFLRFVKDWNEVQEQYGDLTYKALGKVKIKARVVDDSESLFTPCSYKITDVQILAGENTGGARLSEISSFRGRFCEIARKGESVISGGKLELVTDKSGGAHERIVVGEDKEDFLTLS